MNIKHRKIPPLAAACLASCLLAHQASAAVTTYAWIRAGELGIQADSSGKNHPFNAAFSSGCDGGAGGGGLTAAVLSPIAAGGPLGGTAATSTVSTRWGSFNCGNSGMWVQGPNNTVPPPEQWSLPPTNWVMEAWVIPAGTGASKDRTDAQFMSTGSSQFGGIPGGAAFRTHFGTDDEGNEAILIQAHGIGPAAADNFVIGDPFAAPKDKWTHVAVVNSNGVTTFYVNGVAHGAPSTAVTAPSGVPYIGSGQDTGAAFNGYLDELRYSTFAPGEFAVSDLLLLPPGPGFISKPQSAVVWEGGAAPFTVVTTLDPANTFQWKRGVNDIAGATGSEYVIPAVVAGDSGSTFTVSVSNGGTPVATPEATLTVVPKQTENTAFYRAAVQGEASLLAFFPVDGDLGATVANAKDNTHPGTLQASASYDGRTNRAFGERSIRLNGSGSVTIPANPAYEFADGTGTVEALVYLDPSGLQTPRTIFSLAADTVTAYAVFQAGADGNSLQYKNDANTQGASWSVSPSLAGRLAHVAFAFTAGKVTAYVDGVSLGTKDNPSFGGTAGLQANVGSAGSTPEGNLIEPWNGTIDELAIYGDALSDNTIAIHNSRFIFGTAVTKPTIVTAPAGTWNLLAGGAPIFRVVASGTAPLTYQWKLNGAPVMNNPTATTPQFTILNSTVDSSGSYTVTVSNPIGDATSDPFTVNFTAPPAGDKYAGIVLADHPTAYWRLNEATGNRITDYAGGFDGVYDPAKVDLGQAGPMGIDPDKAAHFKAAGTGGQVPYSPVLNPTGPFSLEFWAKPDRSGNIGRAILGTQNRNTGRAGYAIYQGFNGAFWEAHLGFGESVLFLQGTTVPTAGRWDHVVVTWDGANVGRIYVNGKDEGGATGGPHRNNLSQPLEFGSRFNGSVPYDGTIDEVAFYNYRLTPEQVEHHFSIAYFPSAVTSEPADVPNGLEAGTITLVAGVTGFPNTYQWFKDNVALDGATTNPDDSLHYPQGVTSATLVISQALPSDGGKYHLVVTNPLGGSTTKDATVSVALDVAPPKVVYVTASSTPDRVRVAFDKPVTAETAGVFQNYTFTGGLTAKSVTLTKDARVLDVVTTGMTPGSSYTLSVSAVTDTRISHNPIGANSTAFKSHVVTQGVLAWDYYYNITGTSVPNDLVADAQFPDGVYTNGFLTSFSTMAIGPGGDLGANPAFGAALGQNFGAHVYGWITPVEGGNYTFFLRSDDGSQLYLGADATPGSVTLIAEETGCCEAFKEPGDGVLETSAPIALAAGTSYYIEAYYKEGGGGDFVEVAWRKEGDATPAASLTPIPGTFLSARAPIPAPNLNTPTLGANGVVTVTWTGNGTLQESSDLKNWTNVAGNPTSGFTVTPGDGAHQFYRVVQ